MDGISARALEFAILTAARSGEVLGARWDEIDLREKIWTVPARRMKGAAEKLGTGSSRRNIRIHYGARSNLSCAKDYDFESKLRTAARENRFSAAC